MWQRPQRRPRQPQPLPCQSRSFRTPNLVRHVRLQLANLRCRVHLPSRPRSLRLAVLCNPQLTPLVRHPRPRRSRRLPARGPALHLPLQLSRPRLQLRLGLSRRRRPLRQACLPQPRPRGNRLFLMPSPCRHLLRLCVTRLRIRLPRCQSRSMLRLANLRVEPCQRQIVYRPLPSAKGKGKTKMTKARTLLTPVRRSIAVGFRRRSGPRLIMETLMWRRPRMRIRRHSPRPVRPRRRLTRSTRSHPCLRGRGRSHLDPDCNLQRSRRRASSSRHQSKPSCSL
jgi:hypothetical protein